MICHDVHVIALPLPSTVTQSAIGHYPAASDDIH